MAVWLLILLLKGALVELLEAEGTHKVFRVKLLVHGSNAAACDGFVAASTQRPSLGMVVCLTEWHAVMVVETATSKRCVALLSTTDFSENLLFMAETVSQQAW